MKASDIMTHSVITATPETMVPVLARLMIDHGISAVPIVRAGELLGIVSEGDLLRRAKTGTERRRSRWLELATPGSTLADEYIKSHGQRAADVMTCDVVTVSPDTAVADIADLMESRRVKRVSVVQDRRLVGLVSRANLVQALASGTGTVPAEASSDVEMRKAILDEIRRAPAGALPADVNVIVRSGVVYLFGLVHSEQERRALRVAIENAAEVADIKDRMTYPAKMLASA